MWFAAQILVSFLPSLLIQVLHQNADDVSVLELVMSPITSAAMIALAVLSQRVGRRTVLFWTAASSSVCASLAFAFMVALARNGSPFLAVAVLAIVASVFVNGPLGNGLLQPVMPFEYAPVVLIALGGVLFAIGARLGPETVTDSTLDAETADAVPAAVPASRRVTTDEMS